MKKRKTTDAGAASVESAGADQPKRLVARSAERHTGFSDSRSDLELRLQDSRAPFQAPHRTPHPRLAPRRASVLPSSSSLLPSFFLSSRFLRARNLYLRKVSPFNCWRRLARRSRPTPDAKPGITGRQGAIAQPRREWRRRGGKAKAEAAGRMKISIAAPGIPHQK